MPMNTFAQYLADNKIRQEDFAAKIGVKQATISRLKRGVSSPQFDTALKIQKATNGKVPITAWPEFNEIVRAAS